MPKAWPVAVLTLLVVPTLLLAAPAHAASAELAGQLDAPTTGNTAVFEPASGKFYVMGGRTTDGSYSDGVFEFDAATRTLHRVATLPTVAGSTDKNGQPFGGRQSATATALNGKVYLFGGAAIVTTPNPADPNQQIPVPKAIKDIVEFDPARRTTRTLAAQLPSGVWGAASAAYAGSIYVFGGFTFDLSDSSAIARHDTIAVFDPNDPNPAPHSIGTAASKLPYAVQDAAAVTIGQQIYLMGGLMDDTPPTYPCPKVKYYNQTTGGYDDVEPKACTTDIILRFNPSFETVSGVFARLPYRSQFLSAGVVDDKAVIPGARLGDGRASTSILSFDPRQSEDARVKFLAPTLPQGFFAAGAASDGNVVYSFGGRGSSSADLYANVTRIDPRATVPWAPRSPSARTTSSTVELAWDVPAYDGDSPVTSYRVYRAGEDGVESLVSTVTTLTYSDKGLTPGAAYAYRITAMNAVGESATAARASSLAEITPPGAVSNFQAFPGNGEVELRWGAPADSGGAALTGYRVYVNGGATPARQTLASATSASISGLPNGVEASFVVRAVNSKGEGAASPTLRATPKAVPATPEQLVATSSASGVALSWAAAPTPVRSVTVLRGTNPAQIFPIANLSGSDTHYLDTTALRGRSYYYEVSTTNDIGASPPSPYVIVSLVSKPGAPTNLAPVALPGTVRLTWQAPLDSGEADPATMTYQVRRDGRILATDLKGLAYEDKGLLANRSYSYSVVAFNGLESDPSEAVTAAAKAVENKAPTAALLMLTTVVKSGESVSVDASGSTDPDGTIATYAFDFGDNTAPSRSATPNATHVYAVNGTYTVSLVVTDNRGATSRASTATVVVGDPNQVQDNGVSTTGTPGPTASTTKPPGSGTPKKGIPDAPLAAVALAAALVAVASGRRRRT